MDLKFLESIAIEYRLSPAQTEAFSIRFDPARRRESDTKLSGELNISVSAFKKRLEGVYKKFIPLCKDLKSSKKRGKVEILWAALQRQWEQERAEPATLRLKISKPFPNEKLPDNFVNRPEAMNAVKAKLLRDDDRTLVVTAIAGLGGIGKSVLASALTLDKEVREWFVDGILWVPLGQSPVVLQSRLEDCIRELDKSPDTFSANTLKKAAQYLDRLLMDRKMLLVLDDVWNAAHADWFRVSQGSCRILVTTREARLEEADYYILDVMTGDEAIELVRQKLGQQWKPEQEADVRAFAKVLGHLPLALDLAANQVRDGLSWQELRLEFEVERRAVALGTGRRSSALKLLNSSEAWEHLSEEEQRTYSLQACFNLSLKRLNHEQFKCFVWLGVLPEDINLDARVAAILWNFKLVEAQQVLIVLRNRSLLTTGVDTSEGKPSYRIHDLIHDLARNSIEYPSEYPPSNEPERLGGLGLSLPTAHAQFLERYRQLTPDRRWDKLPNDGYIYRHLTWHMMQANWLDEIHSLMEMSDDLGRNAWFEACDRIGQSAIFVGDIARAWELAESIFDKNPEASVKLQIHYALITATLKSFTDRIPPNWIKLLVEHKYWTFEKAWSHTLEIQDRIQQVYTIFALCSFIPNNIVPDVVSIISLLEDDNKLQCLVIDELSKYVELDDLYYLNKSQGKEVVELSYSSDEISQILLDISREEKEDNYDKVEVLMEVVSDISKDNLDLFLELCHDLDCGTQVELLCELFKKFPHLKSQALEIFSSMSIEDENYNHAICSLASIEHSFADEAALFVLDTVHFSEISFYLPKIVDCISDSRLDEFLSFVIFSTPDPYYQAEILGIIAPFLNNEMFMIALGIATEIGLDGFRFSALDDLAPHIKREQVQESFELVLSLQNDFERIWSLIRFGTLNDEIWMIVIRELNDGLKMNQFQWILLYRNLIHFLPKQRLCEIDLEVFTGNERDKVTNIILKIDMLSRGMLEASEIVDDILRISDDDDFEVFILLVLLASNLDKESLLAFASLFSIDRDDNVEHYLTSDSTEKTAITSEWESLLLEISQRIDVSNTSKYIHNDLSTTIVDICNQIDNGNTDLASFLTHTNNFLLRVPEICPGAAGLPHFVRDRLFYSLLEIETAISPYCNVIRDALILCVLDCKSEKYSIDRVLFQIIYLTLEELIGLLETISMVEAKSIIDEDRNLYSGKELKMFESIEDYTKFKLLMRDVSHKGRQELIPFLALVLNLFRENTRRDFSSIVAELIMKNCKQWQ